MSDELFKILHSRLCFIERKVDSLMKLVYVATGSFGVIQILIGYLIFRK